MNIINNKLYIEDVEYVSSLKLPWDKLQKKNFLISGGTGLIGSFLIDVLLFKKLNSNIYILTRDKNNSKSKFSHWAMFPEVHFIQNDVSVPLLTTNMEEVDYVLHMASNTHPIQYSKYPIETITTNIFGLKNLLDFSVAHQCRRFVFLSSNEIYGENRGDTELFDENYCGYINSNTLRAGYSESKRCGEALCQAYRHQLGLDIVISRLTRSYGPTIRIDDSKAISQFIRKGIHHEDIVLKSEGNQFYSYTYMADAVAGVLTILMKGIDGEAYNVADERSDIKLKDLAKLIADFSGTNVVFEIPDQTEAIGYSTATKARINADKIKKIGWSAHYDIVEGIGRTLQILSEINK